MKIQVIAKLAATLIVVTVTPVFADPLSIRGIDWSMSQAEQVSALEQAGLDCVIEAGWNSTWRSALAAETTEGPLPICFANKGPGADVEALRQARADWVSTCQQTGNTAPSYYKHEYKALHDRLEMVWFRDGGVIIFECEFLGSCGYSSTDVVRQLQRQVVAADFKKPSADALVVCADGPGGDQVCLHLYSSAVWLIQNPDEGTIQF